MPKTDLTKLTIAELQKKKQVYRTMGGTLIGALSVLIIVLFYGTLNKPDRIAVFIPLAIIPLALSPIVLLIFKSAKDVQKEIDSRGQ